MNLDDWLAAGKPLNSVVCCDCLDGMKHIAGKSVDLVLTDPPYGINYLSNYYKNGNPHKPILNDDTLFCPTDDMWSKLHDDGCMFVFHSHKIPLVDKRIRNVLIWVKNNWTAGDLNGDFGNQYECIAFLPKDNFKLHSKRYSNVWLFDRVSAECMVHPTEKPVSLLQQLIESGTDEGAIILDPFGGSGTTAIAAKMLGRNFILFEKEESYCNIAEHRIASTQGMAAGLKKWIY